MTGSVFPQSVRDLLDRPLVAIVSTVSPTGRAQSSIVWFERRGDELVIFTPADSHKVRNLRANPHIVIVVVDPDRSIGAGTPCYVRLTGTADLRPAEDGIADAMARRYGHPDGYPWPIGPILNIHVPVERVSGLGPFTTKRMGGWLL